MKRITKKALSLLLSLVMVVALLPTVAFAADTSVTIGKTTADNVAGTTVTVPLTLANNPGITGAKIKVAFDKDALTLVKVEAKSTLALTFVKPDDKKIEKSNETGTFVFVWTGADASNGNGEIAVMTFAVAEGATEGEKAITATVGEDDFADADMNSIPVTVVNGSVTLKNKPIPATKVTLDKTTLSLEEGASAQLIATVTPANSTDTVTWQSSDTKVATVDENGNVTAVAAGKATITVTAGSKKATCAVTVTEKACEHTNIVKGAEAKNATCSEAGNVEYWVCNDCGKMFSDAEGAKVIADVTIPALGHKVDGANMTHHDAVAPDCKNDGNVEYWTCSDCGNNFVKDKKGNLVKTEDVSIPATGEHFFDWENAEVVAAGVPSETIGVKKATCKGCDTVSYEAFLELADKDCVTIKVVKDPESVRDIPKGVKFTLADKNFDGFVYEFVTAGGEETCAWDDYYAASGATQEEAIAALKETLKIGSAIEQTTGKKSGWTLDQDKYTISFTVDDNNNVTVIIKKNGEVTDKGIVFTNIYKATKSSGGFKDPDGVYKDLMDGKSNNPAKSNDKTIKSSKTFDAGIGLYVGLSILSLTGSAVVIGKKKVR